MPRSVNNQAEHHKGGTFREELPRIRKKYHVGYQDEVYGIEMLVGCALKMLVP